MLRFCLSFLIAAGALKAASADWVWTAHYVVTMDPQHRIIDRGAVAIVGSKIVAVGTEVEILKHFQPRQRLNAGNAIISPGLINTHTHAAMSLLRGIADDKTLQDWLQNYIFPAEAKNVTPEFVRWGTRLACLEMLLSGTTTYTDMYYFEEVVAEATKEAGMRGVLGQTIIQFPVADAKTPGEGIERAAQFLKRFDQDSLITPAVAPHAVYTNSDDTLKRCRALANQYHKPLLIHVSETKKENEDLFAKRKLTPTRLLQDLGVLDGRTVAAHCVWVGPSDLRILKSHNTGIAHCPSSNMKLASGVAPVVQFLRSGVALGLGTDGVAGSNNDVDLFEEMDLAAKLQKVTTGDPQAIRAEEAVAMATIGGARVLGMESVIGSVETGKLADLIVISLNSAHATPLYNVYSQMVYALKGSDVRDVMVNGKILVRDARPLTLNSPEILQKAIGFGRKVGESLGK